MPTDESLVQLEPATPADLDAVAELIAAHCSADYGEVLLERSDIEAEWQQLSLEQSTCLLRASTGTLIGYGSAVLRPQSSPASVDLRMYQHPHSRDHASAARMITTLEAMAWSQANSSAVMLHALTTNDIGCQAFEAVGFARRIAFQTMTTALESAPASTPISGLSLRPFRIGHDEQVAYAADEEASRDKGYAKPVPFETWAARMLAAPHLCTLAWDGDTVAGGIFCAPIDANTASIHHLGVRQPWRRRGLGEALMQMAFASCWQHNLRRITLDVDSASHTGADRLYTRMGMAITGVRTLYSKQLNAAPHRL